MDKKLTDLLFTARWAVKVGKNTEAYDALTDALEHAGALPSIKEVEPPPIEHTTPEPETHPAMPEPRFVKVKGTNFKESRYATPSRMAEGLVVHYTVSGRSAKNAEGVLRYLASKNLGCMVMDEDGVIYVPESFDVMKDAAAHAGASKWNGHNGLNDEFAGLEICNWGRSSTREDKYGRTREAQAHSNIIKGWYQPYTEAQERAIPGLVKWMMKRNPSFKIDNVCGHDEARASAGRPGDKQDPGASLSMTMPELRENLKKAIG